MKDYFQNLAEEQGWFFEYSREDYQNLVEVPLNGKPSVALFVDPIIEDSKFSEIGNETKTYSGKLLLLVNSDVDESYQDKSENHIEVLKTEYLQNLKNDLACSNYQVNSFRTQEIINLFDQNFDGLLVTYSCTLID